MKIHLVNTIHGLIPAYDEDYDEKKKLVIGEEYIAEIKQIRNPRLLRKYHSMIDTAWSYLPERTSNGFRKKEKFRGYVEVAAGYYEPFYHPRIRDWVEIPMSIAYANMDESTFEKLYEDVRDVIMTIIGQYVSVEEFEKNLSRY